MRQTIEELGMTENLKKSGNGIARWIGRFVPNTVVLLALGVLGYWGHQTGWALPKIAALNGDGEIERGDWCLAHNVAASQCVECRPELVPKGKEFGWCKQHGVPECPWEHPEVAQLPSPPAITQADLARAQGALDFAERPENNSKCKLHLRRIQFASATAFEKAGIEVAPVWPGPVIESVPANGEISYDQTQVARLSARVPGTVWHVARQAGDRVKQGEVLALVEAPEVGRAKAEFLQSLLQVELKTRTLANMREAGSSLPARQLQETEASAHEAQIRLLTAQQALVNLGLPIPAEDVKRIGMEELAKRIQFVGLPESVARTLDANTTTGNLLPLKAPLDGVVVAREVVAGEEVDTTKVLFIVANVDRMWLTMNIQLEDMKKLAVGQHLRFRADGSAGEVKGTITWMSTAADEKTRTIKVRAELDNPGHRLRANTFGKGRIVLREEKNAVILPNEAIHWEGDCFVVFIRDKNYDPQKSGSLLMFHVRKVRPGAKDDKQTEVIAGVLPGEVVATKGSGALRAELLKNNIGEG